MDPTATASVLVAVASAIAGVAASYYGWRAKKLTSEESQRLKFYSAVIAECDSLRKTSTELQKQVFDLSSQVDTLKGELSFYRKNLLAVQARVMLEFVMNTRDKPMWIHHVGENRWYLNDAYCQAFSVERHDFWTAVNLFAHYDAEDLLEYTRHDIRVVESNAAAVFIEPIRMRIMDPSCTDEKYGMFRKSPLKIGEHRFVMGELISDLTDNPDELSF